MKRLSDVFEGLRLIGSHSNGTKSTKIYRDSEWNEYRVKHYDNGVHQQDADYHTDDVSDAHDTAKSWVKEELEEELEEGCGCEYVAGDNSYRKIGMAMIGGKKTGHDEIRKIEDGKVTGTWKYTDSKHGGKAWQWQRPVAEENEGYDPPPDPLILKTPRHGQAKFALMHTRPTDKKKVTDVDPSTLDDELFSAVSRERSVPEAGVNRHGHVPAGVDDAVYDDASNSPDRRMGDRFESYEDNVKNQNSLLSRIFKSSPVKKTGPAADRLRRASLSSDERRGAREWDSKKKIEEAAFVGKTSYLVVDGKGNEVSSHDNSSSATRAADKAEQKSGRVHTVFKVSPHRSGSGYKVHAAWQYSDSHNGWAMIPKKDMMFGGEDDVLRTTKKIPGGN